MNNAVEVEQQSATTTATTLLDSLESELEQFTSSLVTTNFDDTELFKYFLNEDFVDSSGSEGGGGGFPLSSPLSGSSLGEPNSNDSPQPSPPQLSPDRTDFITSAPLVSVPSVPVFQHSSVKIKEEPIDIRTDGAELKKNGRKRTAPVKEPETPVVALSRDELLKLSGKADNIQGRPEVDEKQQKRQKRLIKNRESAQLSRLRKKIYIEELEKKVTHLSTDNENLTKQVVSLNGDKKRLQDEVVYLQSLIKQSPELSAVLASRKGMQPKNLKAAGVCLLVILFSVGLFFNSNQNPNLPFSRASREEIPEVVPKSTLYTGRVLKSVNEEPVPKIEYPASKGNTEEYDVVIPVAKEVVLKGRKHDREEDVRFESSLVEKQDKTIPVSRRKRVKISEEESDDNKGLVPLDVAQLKHNTEIVPRRNPNASYIYCPEAHHMAPAVTGDGPELVAILLPASVLNGTLYGDSIPNLSNTLLEVSCQVLNLHMWPMNNTQH